MRHLLDLFHRFRRDDAGAFGVIFAVMAIVLVAMSGAVVDFTSVQQSRTRAQVALDAASLALQPRIYDTTAAIIQTQAQALLVDRLADATTNWADCTKNANVAPCATVSAPKIDIPNGRITLTATLKVQMNFVSLVGVPTMTAQIVSVATRQKLNLEVALVLDNSGSMATAFGSGKNSTRMTVLQSSANCAANILFYNLKDCTPPAAGTAVTPDVKMALVPFNDEVNVGKGNINATWLDRKGGLDTFANDNFDFSDAANGTTTYNAASFDRTALFSNVPWGGCVEARKNDGANIQYDTDDTAPDSTNHDTLFTPLFAPDEPDSGGYSNSYISDAPAACQKIGSCSDVQDTSTTYNDVTVIVTAKGTQTVKNKKGVVTSTTSITSTFTTGPAQQSVSSPSTSQTGATKITAVNGATQTGVGVCSCTGQTLLSTNSTNATATNGTLKTTNNGTTTTPANPASTTDASGNVTSIAYASATKSTQTQPMIYTVTATNTCKTPYQAWDLTPRQLQERVCKYTGATLTKTIKLGVGPNADCPASAILPLTNTPATLTTAINAMVANGNTNVQEGAAWGFRTLSPTAPFTEALGYDKATSKVMIVMTDGENTYNVDNGSGNQNGTDLYAAYAYPWNNYRAVTTGYRGRMGNKGWSELQYETSINSRLATTCSNAKLAGITIYTIGLATSATSDPTGNKKLLTDCASDTTKAYFPTTATDLTSAFTDIANQLAALRLAQ